MQCRTVSLLSDVVGLTGRLGAALWRDGRGRVLLVVSLGWLLTIGIRIVYPALLPAIRSEFGFGYATAGALVSLVWAAYAVFQFPGGLLADVTSHRTALVAGTAVTGGLGLVVPVVDSDEAPSPVSTSLAETPGRW